MNGIVTELKIKSIKNVLDELRANNNTVFIDDYGSTRIMMGEGLLQNFLSNLIEEEQTFKLIVSPLVENMVEHYNKQKWSHCPNQIVCVGASTEFNRARQMVVSSSGEFDTKLISFPVPLSNDAFCTDRFRPIETESFDCSKSAKYASTIVADLHILHSVDSKLNVPGLGEVLGLYTSVMDYYQSHDAVPPPSLIELILDSTDRLLVQKKCESDQWIFDLYQGLILKCLVMRVAAEHSIGAAGDHLIAYVLEELTTNTPIQYTHGELVLLGTITMLQLYTNWQNDYYNVEDLLRKGIEIELLNISTFSILMNNFNQIIHKAPKTRRNRCTVLSNIGQRRIDDAYSALRKIGEILFE